MLAYFEGDCKVGGEKAGGPEGPAGFFSPRS